MRGVGFERARNRSDQILPRVVQFLLRDALAHDATISSSIDAIARSTFAGPTPARIGNGPSRCSRRASSTRSRPSPVARGCCRPAGRRWRTDRRRCSSARRVVSRVAARDCREAVRDVGLRLVHHRDDDPLATSRGDDRRRSGRGDAAAAPAAEDTRRHIVARGRFDVADERPPSAPHGAKRPACCRARSVARQRFDDLDRPLRPAAVRVTVRYRCAISVSMARTAGLSSSCRIAVMTSPLRVAISSSASDGAMKMSPSNASTGSKSSDQAGADEREDVAVDGDGEADAATVELLRNHRRRPRRRSAIDQARQQPRRCRVRHTGSEAEPARMARLIATAGVVGSQLWPVPQRRSRARCAPDSNRSGLMSTLHTSDLLSSRFLKL